MILRAPPLCKRKTKRTGHVTDRQNIIFPSSGISAKIDPHTSYKIQPNSRPKLVVPLSSFWTNIRLKMALIFLILSLGKTLFTMTTHSKHRRTIYHYIHHITPDVAKWFVYKKKLTSTKNGIPPIQSGRYFTTIQ